MAEYAGKQFASSALGAAYIRSLGGGGTITTQRLTKQRPAPIGVAPTGVAPGAGIAPGAAPTKRPTLTPSAREAWERAIEQYRPGGGYGAGVEAGLERGRIKAVAGGTQALVSAGLAGTTEAAGLGKRYEEEVGAPTRARTEEVRAQAIANLLAGLAAAEERGYETAEERALRERLTTTQLATQREIAGGQLGLGYAELGGRERIAAQQLTAQQQIATQQLTAQQQIAAGELGLGYAGLGAKERGSIAARQLAMQQLQMQMQQLQEARQIAYTRGDYPSPYETI